MALEEGQTKNAYIIVFNRCRPEADFIKEFRSLTSINKKIKGFYIKSMKGTPRHYDVVYLNHWDNKLRYENQ